MSTSAEFESMRSCDRNADVIDDGQLTLAAVFEASFKDISLTQDAPRALMSNNCFLARTRLASPNRLNSCVSFLAKPL